MAGLDAYRNARVGILGLARSGLAAADALARAGAEVLAFDDKPEALAEARLRGLATGALADVASLALLVPSPGVPLTHPEPHAVIRAAQSAGVPIRGDIDLFAAATAPRRIVGITGTNGKSTTTALIHHLLAQAGVDAAQGGNIGTPVFALDPGSLGRLFVLELSSFQLDLCADLRCAVAVWLNLTADHLDRHGDLDGYIQAKRRIFRNQQAEDAAVIGVDDAPSRAVAEALAQDGRRVIEVSLERIPPAGVAVRDGILLDAFGGEPQPVFDLRGLPRLPGRHNQQNAAVAYATLRALGLSPASATAGFASFEGLPHRLEEVASARGVRFVNDSKATNPDAAARALDSFPTIWWIAGGKPKPGGFASLAPFAPHVRRAFLIGEAAAEIERDLGQAMPTELAFTLDVAVARAAAAAWASPEEGVVLLAPACASYDQFANFEARGEAFRALAQAAVRGLP